MIKRIFLLGLITCIAVIFSQCKKENPAPVTPAANKDYQPLTAGSTFSYNDTTNGTASVYTQTVTSNTIVRNGKNFVKLSNSNGSEQYIAKSGVNYYQLTLYSSLHGGEFEDNYLNDSLPVDSSWTVAFKTYNPLGFPDSLYTFATYKIAGKGLSMTINGTVFTEVIHVSLTDVSAYSQIPPSSSNNLITRMATGEFYYARGVGLIKSELNIDDNPPYNISAYKTWKTLASYHIN